MSGMVITPQPRAVYIKHLHNNSSRYDTDTVQSLHDMNNFIKLIMECLLLVHQPIYILHLSLSRDIDGLVQDCSISSALAMEILQSGTKP